MKNPYLLTIMASGTILVEAESEEAARRLFDEEEDIQADAAAILAKNGIDVSDVRLAEEA